MKNTITEIKNTLKGINNRLYEPDQISDLEDKVAENPQSTLQIGKKVFSKRNEDNLRDLCDNIKHNSMSTEGVLN